MRVVQKVTFGITGAAAGCLLVLVAVSTAHGRAGSPEIRRSALSTQGQVVLLAADGDRVAASTSTKFSPGGKPCPGRIVVWSPQSSRARTVDLDHYCDGGCFGVDELALGGGRVAWIEEGGGNSLELILRAVRLAGGEPTEIERRGGDYCEAHGTSNGSYIGQLFGAGALLAWNAWDLECKGGYCAPGKRLSKTVERLVAGMPGGVKNSASARGLVAVGGGRVAVASNDTITVLAPNGARLATVPATGARRLRSGSSIGFVDAFAVAMDETRLAVERASTLDLFDTATGAKTKSFPLGKAARFDLAGINAKVALLRNSSGLVLLRFSDGKRVSIPQATGKIVAARLTDAGAFFAYNTPGAAPKGHIVFEPTAVLLRRF